MTRAVIRWLRGLVVLAGGVLLVAWPERAPLAVVAGLVLALGPLVQAWRGARGTGLGAAVVWGVVAVALGVVAEALALAEPMAGGRPAAGHVTYLATLAALAGLISVLNARAPGGGAWAVLMVLLVLVFLIPWLEGSGLGRAPKGLGRLRLDSPWTIFYGLLVLAGVTNYLPTRFGLAAAWLGLGFVLEYLGLTQPGRSAGGRAVIWSAVPWTFAAAVATAELRARAAPAASGRLEAVWFWFRDHWGVVWALRVLERFNRSAEAGGWPVRLTWQGVVANGSSPPTASVPVAAEATLKGLLRRFARPDRIDRAVARDGEPPCQPGGAGR
jgi:hypothetical protein